MATLLQHLYITLVLCSAGISGYTYEGSCVPDCTDVTDRMIVDPRNCRKYYTCHDEVASSVAIDCGIGNYFDNVIQQCKMGDCGPQAPCTPKCHFECKGLLNPISASRTDCTKSLDCFPGGTESYQCSNSPFIYFDGTNCQNDINKCCDPCMVYCPLGVSFVADPFDCTRYYYCEYASFFPGDEHVYKCPAGQYFNPYSEQCSTDSSCDQLCSGSTPPGITTPPQTSDCHDNWLCTEYGYFPACSKHCSPRYFYCDTNHIGSLGVEYQCSDNDKVIHPDTIKCVYLSQCPYDPEI